MITIYKMANEFIKTLETAYSIAMNKEIPYIERRETVKQYYNKANNIYRKIYKDLAWSERREAREPINDLKKHFRF